MKFISHTEAKFHIPNGIMLVQWLVDNIDNRKILEKFYIGVMRNTGRKAIYISKGGMISLYVNDITKVLYRKK